jgi:8-oxo-dGTP pyrophosphatase MutT (NUDIX family)
MASGVLIFNESGELLIVKTHYKNYWSLLGGIIEKNESPRTTALRETKEEIGIDLLDVRFVCLDYMASCEGKDEFLQFIFYGGILNADQIKQIKLYDAEIEAFQFAKIENIPALVSERFSKRLSKCLEAIKNNTAIYLEDGE